MSDEIEWGDPPAKRGGKPRLADWAEVRYQLQARPGDWARVVKATWGSTASHLRHGANGFTVGSYEIRTVATANKRTDIYARYVGND